MRSGISALIATVCLLLLPGCGSESAPSVKPTLSVQQVQYDCTTRQLTVTGSASPAREGQGVQVQVRSEDHPRAPVWRIAPTNAQGVFEAVGRYSVRVDSPTELWVRLASVVAGNRVFSARTVQPVNCPSG